MSSSPIESLQAHEERLWHDYTTSILNDWDLWLLNRSVADAVGAKIAAALLLVVEMAPHLFANLVGLGLYSDAKEFVWESRQTSQTPGRSFDRCWTCHLRAMRVWLSWMRQANRP
jgi:hypothetical protein